MKLKISLYHTNIFVFKKAEIGDWLTAEDEQNNVFFSVAY